MSTYFYVYLGHIIQPGQNNFKKEADSKIEAESETCNCLIPLSVKLSYPKLVKQALNTNKV